MGTGYLDSVDVAAIILIIISCIIFIPILVYSLYRFHSIARTEFVKHRNPAIVYIINILSVFCFLSERIFAICMEVIFYGETSLPFWTVHIGVNFIVVTVYVLCVIRTWLLYYNRNYHIKIVENVWKKDINSDEISWFIRNKNKSGSLKYIFTRIAFLPSIIFIVIEIITDIIIGHGIHDHFLSILLPLTIYIASFILYYKISDFDDAFNIRKEIYYQCITFFAVMCAEIIDLTVVFIVDAVQHHDHSHEYHHYLERVEWLISASITYVTLFALSLISTAYPVYLYLNIEQGKKLSAAAQNAEKKKDFSSMLAAIGSMDGYKSFITHLVNHFATENLLFITELIQIKHNFQTKHNNTITTVPRSADLVILTESDVGCNVVFADSACITIDFSEKDETVKTDTDAIEIYFVGGAIEKGVTFSGIFDSENRLVCKINLPFKLPQSKILTEYNGFIDQMICLFNKYVNVNSEYEINISGETRSLLIQIFANIKNIQCTENYLFNIMDDACIEILQLCHSSYIKYV